MHGDKDCIIITDCILDPSCTITRKREKKTTKIKNKKKKKKNKNKAIKRNK